MRNNLCGNPEFAVDLTTFWTLQPGAVRTSVTDMPDGLSGWVARVTATIVGNANQYVAAGYNGSGSVIAVNPGETWTVSCHARANTGTPGLRILTEDNTGHQIDPAGDHVFPNIGTSWGRYSVTFTVPAGTTGMQPFLCIASTAIGDVIDITRIVIEKQRSLLPYFTGDTVNCTWDGIAGKSTSTWHSLTSTGVRRNLLVNPSWRHTSGTAEMRRNICTNPAFESGTTTGWANYAGSPTLAADPAAAYSGAYGLTVTTDGTAPVPRVNMNFPAGAVAANDRVVVSTRIRPVSGTGWAAGVSPYIVIRGPKTAGSGGGEWTSAYNPTTLVPDANGWWLVTYAATVDPNTDTSLNVNIGAYNGATNAPSGAKFQVDEVLVEKNADVSLGYFDGDTPALNGLTAAWTSTRYLSAATLTGPAVVNYPFAAYVSTPGVVSYQSDPAGVMRFLAKRAIGAGALLAFASTAPQVPVTVGQMLKARVQARIIGSSVDVKVHPRLLGYTSAAGSVTGWICDSVVDLTIPATGAWTDLLVPPGVAVPATAVTARWLIYVGTGGIPAGSVIEFRDCLVEPAASLTDSVFGPYFDGSTAGAVWDGTADQSTSQALGLPAAAPTMPQIGVKVWTGENPPTSPSGVTTDPLILTDRAVSLKTGRGRQYELDQDEAGTWDVVVVNDDGGVTGDVASGRIPMRQCKLEATWDGTTYPIATGYVSAWPDEQRDPATGRATVSGVDLFEALAQRPLKSVVQETVQAVSVGPPAFYYRLNDDTGAAGGGNAGTATAYPTAPLVDFKLGTASLAFGGAGFLNNTSETCLSYSNTTANRARQMQISGPQNVGGPKLDTTQPWMASVFLDATAGNSSVFNVLDPQGNIFAYISFDTTVGGGQVTVYAGGNGITWGGLNGYLNSSLTGGGMQVSVGFDGTHGIGYVLGANATTWTYTPKGTLSWIAAGPAFNSSVIFGSSQGTFRLSHLAVWTGSIPTAQDLSDINYAGYWSWNADAPESRVVRILKWTGHTGIVYETDDLALANMPDTKGAAALDTIRASTLSTLSRFFIGKDGLARLWYRHHGQTATAKWVFGGNTAAGELPYEGSPKWDFDTAHVFNDVEVNRSGGATQRAANATSAGRYFDRLLQVDTALYYDSAAQQMAQWLAGQYGDPVERIEELKLHPAAYPALWPAVLGMELGDIVQVNHPSLTGIRSGLYQVAHIAHDVDASVGEWFTTLQLTPFVQEWVLAAMHTTLTAFAAAGATSITLAPLPDSATNPAEASLAVGTTLMLDPASPYRETVTIKSVTSVPTAHATGYTSITVGVTATTNPHAAGSVACDPLPTGETDPTAYDARSVLDSTTVLSF